MTSNRPSVLLLVASTLFAFAVGLAVGISAQHAEHRPMQGCAAIDAGACTDHSSGKTS